MSKSKKEKLLNCYQDLQRAALSYYRNPAGKAHLVFLNHATRILNELEDKRLKKLLDRINGIDINLKKEVKDKQRLADEILTVGLLLKPRI